MNSIKKYFSVSNNPIINLGKLNKYGGIELDLELVKDSPSETEQILFETIQHWETSKVKSIYVKIPPEFSHLITDFLKIGFKYHHTKGNNLFISKWLDKGKSRIPEYCHHHVGVGACIMNEKMEFLLIQEVYSTRNKDKKPLWKFVTGLIDEEETIVEAVHREVEEETSLKVKYHGCIVISENYPNMQKCKDICFFNFCTTNSTNEDLNKLQLEELTRAKFFSLEELKEVTESEEITLVTKHTMKKVLSLIDVNKSYLENIETMNRNYILTPFLEPGYTHLEYFNIYH